MAMLVHADVHPSRSDAASLTMALTRLFDQRCGVQVPRASWLCLPAAIPSWVTVIEAEVHQPAGTLMLDHDEGQKETGTQT